MTAKASVQEQQEHEDLRGVIERNVLHSLGKPGELQRMQVRRLWNDHYRVNVFVGGDIGSAKVAHSYFLRTDASGSIVASTPAITKQY